MGNDTPTGRVLVHSPTCRVEVDPSRTCHICGYEDRVCLDIQVEGEFPIDICHLCLAEGFEEVYNAQDED